MKALFCQCSKNCILSIQKRQETYDSLEKSGVELIETPDLCEMVANKSEAITKLAAEDSLIVAACHPRAVKWLFFMAGVDLEHLKVTFFNMREDNGTCARPIFRDSSDWEPWFPAIDYDRCSYCGQCLEFCLFGVYCKKDARISVSNPRSCKTNCYACARICPKAAIIFPKAAEEPFNGASIKDEAAISVNSKINLENFFGENPYSALAIRKYKRRKLLKDV